MKTKKVKTKELTVNELNKILVKHFKAESVLITSVDVGNMFNHKDVYINVGGVLTVTVEVTK